MIDTTTAAATIDNNAAQITLATFDLESKGGVWGTLVPKFQRKSLINFPINMSLS
jgi:hypothetical protein